MIHLPSAFHTIICTLHPAHAMRGVPQLKPSIMETMARAARWADQEEGPRRGFEYLALDPTPEEAERYVFGEGRPREIAIDIETPREDNSTILLVGLSRKVGTAICFPHSVGFIELLARILGDKGIIKIGHNFMGFDYHSFRKNGYTLVSPFSDTIQREALIRPPFKEAKDRRWLALSTCLAWHFDGQAYHKEPEDPNTYRLYRAAFPGVPDWLHPRLYCALDTERDLALHQSQESVIAAEGMTKLMWNIVNPAAAILARLEERGMKVDEERRKELVVQVEGEIKGLKGQVQGVAQEYHSRRIAAIEKEIEAVGELEAHELKTHPLFTGKGGDPDLPGLRPCEVKGHAEYRGLTKRQKCEGCAKIYHAAGSLRRKVKDLRGRARKARQKIKQLGPTFKETSNDHWRWLLFDAMGLKPLEVTEKGGVPSVDEKVIEGLQKMYPALEILRWRVDLQVALHSLGNLNVPVDANGRAHYALPLHRTETGRIASGGENDEDDKIRKSEAGNFQNKKEIERQIFCASAPGRCLGEADWKQIELAVAAWIAPDYDLLDAIRSGADVHSLNASAIFGCKVEEARSFLVPFEGQMRPARHAAKRATHGWDYGMAARKTGGMFQPFGLASMEEIREFLSESWKLRRRGISGASVDKLLAAGEQEKVREVANTLRAQEWIDAYFGKWKGLAAWQRETVERVERDGYLVNAFGRKLRFWNWEYRKGKRIARDREEILAFLPQSNVGDMCKAALPGMEEAFASVRGEMLTTTHDSFLGDIFEAARADFVGAARPVLERGWPELGERQGFGLFGCPADFAFGWNWGKKSADNPRGLTEWKA